MTIEVTTPDGGTAEFPDGTHPDIIRQAMRAKFGGGPAKGVAQEMSAPSPFDNPQGMSADEAMAQSAVHGVDPVSSVGKAVSNIPSSAAEFVKNTAQPFIHPIETAENLGAVGKGVLQKLGIMSGKDAEPHADAVGKFLKERYGSWKAVQTTLENDPVGLAADVSMILTAGGSAAARAPGVVGEVARAAGTVGRAVDPLTAVAKTATGIGKNVLAPALGVTTGAGTDAIRIAGRAGAEGGEAGRAFRENLTGAAPMEEVVSDAKRAVSQLKVERGIEYRKAMADVGADKTILDFSQIDQAVNKVAAVKTYKGQNLSPATQGIRKSITDAINDWKKLDPAEFHTPEGIDALKQKIGDIRDGAAYGTPERVVADAAYSAIRKTIVDQVPAYAKIMKGYEEASTIIKEIERTLSVNPKASIDTALRKLQSALRDNVNTNYGKRAELVAFLERAGATHLTEKLAGQALSAAAPRGLGRVLAGGEGLGALSALAAGHPAVAATMIGGVAASSPALVGGAAYGVGAATRLPLRQIGRSAFQAGRLGQAAASGR